MSIFDLHSGFDPSSWLMEKSLKALQVAVSLVDLANEPDTTLWYAKNLKAVATGLIARLAPMVAFLHSAGEKAASAHEWQPMAENGSFEFVRWCKKWNIVELSEMLNSVLAKGRDEEEISQKAEDIKQDIALADQEGGISMKLWIYGHMSMQMLDDHRDREEPHSSPLPHHAAYGSVLRDSADQAESDPGEQKTE